MLLLLNISLGVQGKDIHLAVENSWPPFADVHGQGLSTSLVTRAFSEVGITTKISVVPYARALSGTQAGIYDGCYNVTRQSSTEAVFYFGQTPLLKAIASFYYRKGDAFPYGSIEDIVDQTQIGLIRGYEYGDVYEQHKGRFVETRVGQQQQLIAMLNMERFKAIIMFDRVAKFNVKNMELKNGISKGFVNHTSDIYVAFSREFSQWEYYAKKLDEGIAILKRKGLYKKIMEGEIK